MVLLEHLPHRVLRGFDETDILPFDGTLSPLKVDAGAIVPPTCIPPVPAYPLSIAKGSS